jgi:hypothetical protein
MTAYWSTMPPQRRLHALHTLAHLHLTSARHAGYARGTRAA